MRKAIIFSALVAILVPALHAQRQETGLVIQSWKYNPETKELALSLVNLSGKDITAYGISDSDGSTDLYGRLNPPGEQLEDMLGLLINAQMMGKEPPKDPPNGIIAAGGTRTRILGAKDSSVKAVIDLVVYADGTAEVLNEHAFSQIVAIRKGHLMAMQKVSKAVKQALADPMIANPVAAAVEELKRELAEAEKLNNPEVAEGNERMELQNEVANLERIQRPGFLRSITILDFLKQYVEDMDKRIALVAPHCEIQKII